MKRIKPLLLSVLIGLSMPVMAQFSGGAGTSGSPYEITTAAQLNEVRNNLGSHFKLMNDIDDLEQWIGSNNPDGKGWVPIGTQGNPFTGSFDGAGNKITGLWINRDELKLVGLFGSTKGNTIKDLTLVLARAGVSGGGAVGGLIGDNDDTKVESCSVSGTVKATIDNSRVGGLIGNNNGEVRYCFTSGEVIATESSPLIGGVAGNSGRMIYQSYSSSTVKATGKNALIGGVVGYNQSSLNECHATGAVIAYGRNVRIGGLAGTNQSNIAKSYATGDVTATADDAIIGGVAGDSYRFIMHCYATGAVTAGGKDVRAGGLIGYNESIIQYAYAIGTVTATGERSKVGALIGENSSNTIGKCHYFESSAKEGIGSTTIGSEDITSHSSAEMQQKNSYVSWDFNGVWKIDEDETTPYFPWQPKPYPTMPKPAPEPSNFYNITLEVAEGIELYSLTAGRFEVAEGEDFTLLFLPHDRTLTATDVLLFIDDIETPFKDFGGNYYYSYTLTAIDSDHTIELRLRQSGSETGNADIAADIARSNVELTVDNGQLTINSADGKTMDVSIYNLNGQVVVQRKVIGSGTFTLSAGIYLVRVDEEVYKIVVSL